MTKLRGQLPCLTALGETVLAKDSRPMPPSSELGDLESTGTPGASINNIQEEDDLDDEPDLPVPRLSLGLEEGDDEDESSMQLPPEDVDLHVEEENLTQRSVEVARRAYTELSGRRNTRLSFGSIRFSDRFADVEALKDQASGDMDEDLEASDGAGQREDSRLAEVEEEDADVQKGDEHDDDEMMFE